MRLWRNQAFVVFWSARTISFAGTGITMVVLPVLVYGMTGSPAWVASLGLIEAVPYLSFGLLAGAVADRVNRKKIMVGCDVTAAFLLAAVPAAAALHLLGMAQVLIVALGIATAYVWFDASNFGTLPVLVERAELPVAASLIGSSGQVAFLCAPTIGAVLLTVMRPPYALGFDAASYLISAGLLLSIRRPFGRPRHEQDRLPIRADIGEGLRFLWQQPVIRTLTFSVFCVCLSWGGAFALLVVYANRALHLTHVDVRLGLLYSAGELGGLVSAALVPVLIKRLAIGRLTAAFLAVSAAALAFLAIAPSYGWALLAFFLFELAYIMVITTGITVRQMLTPDHLQARVNTAGRMIAGGGLPVGAVLAGLLAEALPIRLTFGLLAISAVAGAGLAGWSCLGSRPLAAVSVSAPEVQAEGVASLGTVRSVAEARNHRVVQACTGDEVGPPSRRAREVTRPWLRPVAVPDVQRSGRRVTEAGVRHPAQAGHCSLRGIAVPDAQWQVSRVTKTNIRHMRLPDRDRNKARSRLRPTDRDRRHAD